MYNFYPMQQNILMKEFKKLAPNDYKKNNKTHKNDKLKAFGAVFDRLRSFSGDVLMDFIASDEVRWYTSDKQALFVQDGDLLKTLGKTKYNQISDFSLIDPPFKSFVLALPSGFKLLDREISGLLVNYYDSYAQINDCVKDTFERLGIPVHKRPRFIDKYDSDKPAMSINYVVDREDNVSRILAPSSIYQSILKGDDVLGKEDMSINAVELDQGEAELQQALIRLVLSLFVYIQSFGADKVIAAGLPDDVKSVKKLQSIAASESRHSHVTNRTGVKSGYVGVRSGHFRQLMHERFYRGEHANRPTGSRIIYIPPYSVGDLDPSHLVDPE
ncbi:conserved hypothetical protein [Vibrio chagasii]|nr:conserved hypothetical protein [Vibrio chagasii]